jgi:nickel superoxide dismutase
VNISEFINQKIEKIFPSRSAFAHCDIPCGIYDPITAKIAAQTVLKMAVRMEAIDLSNGVTEVVQPNHVSRLIRVKEEHAQNVKNELNILWADYFKPEHLEKYPNLHDLFWNANKLAGANKQGVSSDSARKLVDSVDAIATIFWATKGVNYSDTVSETRFGS